LIFGGIIGRGAVLVAGAVYLSVPLLRASHRPRQPFTSLLVPAALALKDLSKAAGALVGLAEKLARLRRSSE
jgi:hypothetical protein